MPKKRIGFHKEESEKNVVLKKKGESSRIPSKVTTITIWGEGSYADILRRVEAAPGPTNPGFQKGDLTLEMKKDVTAEQGEGLRTNKLGITISRKNVDNIITDENSHERLEKEKSVVKKLRKSPN